MRPDKAVHKAVPRQIVAKLDHLKKINGKLSKMVLRQCESLEELPAYRKKQRNRRRAEGVACILHVKRFVGHAGSSACVGVSYG